MNNLSSAVIYLSLSLFLFLSVVESASAITGATPTAGHADITVKSSGAPGQFELSIDVAWLPWDYDFLCEGEVFETVRCLWCEEVDGDNWLALCESTEKGKSRKVSGTMLDGNGDEVAGGKGSYDTRSGEGKMDDGNTFTFESHGW